MVVKLKMFGIAGFRPSAVGLKYVTPGAVMFKAPSAPVDPLLKVVL